MRIQNYKDNKAHKITEKSIFIQKDKLNEYISNT